MARKVWGSLKTIIIEALSALQGGGKTYLKNLFMYYKAYPNTRVIAFVPAKFKEEFTTNNQIEIRVSEFASKGIMQRIFWNTFILPGILKKLKADVLYSPGGFLATRQVRKCRTAVAFRNMLPFLPDERTRYAWGKTRARLWLLKHIQGASFRDADLVIFISKFAKSVIDLTAGNRQGQSLVVPHGLNNYFLGTQPRPDDPKLPDEYVLYVSILSVYKSQVEVVKAWSQLRASRPTKEKLLLVGPDQPPYGEKVRQTIIELGLEEEVLLFGNVPYSQLPGYYQHAKVNIFASSCENCPNILLEALAAGQPVLCSDYQPMPEFGAEAVKYFDPYNPKQLSTLLQKVLDNPELRIELGKRAMQRAQDFQWDISAKRTWDALIDLANKEQI